jgi:hypothetical protein
MYTSDPFCGGVDDNVGAVVDGSDEESTSTEGVVDNDWDTGLVCNGNDLLEVRDVVLRVPNAFNLSTSVSYHPTNTQHQQHT